MSSELAISVHSVSKFFRIFEKPVHRLLQGLFRHRSYFREFPALRNVSFDVRRGETVGIIGRNGSGKSTLLQLICGTLTASSGEIRVQGRVAALLELGAGFNPEFSGLENVYLNAAIFGMTREEVDLRLDAILQFAEIGDFIHQPVKTYSSGMFVRLAFAVVAHLDADILIIDEALAVGDAFFTQKCMRFLRQFREHGTVLFVSHDTASVVNLCDRAIWLDQGVVRESGSTELVCQHYLKHHFEQQQGPSRVSAVPSETHELSAIERVGGVSDEMAALITTGDPVDTSFGAGGAILSRVSLVDDRGDSLTVVRGGERVRLVIESKACAELAQPLVGFFIKDRLGQLICGENTFLACMLEEKRVEAGQLFSAVFEFQMPYLSCGDYAITAAVGEGTQENHVIHHWHHDAAVFRAQSNVRHGLFGLAMHSISLDIQL